MGLGDGSVVSTHADAWLMKQPFCDSRMWHVDSGDLWGLPKDSALMQKMEGIIGGRHPTPSSGLHMHTHICVPIPITCEHTDIYQQEKNKEYVYTFLVNPFSFPFRYSCQAGPPFGVDSLQKIWESLWITLKLSQDGQVWGPWSQTWGWAEWIQWYH